MIALLLMLALVACASAPPAPPQLPSWVDPATSLEVQCWHAQGEKFGFEAQRADRVPFNAEDRAESALVDEWIETHCQDYLWDWAG